MPNDFHNQVDESTKRDILKWLVTTKTNVKITLDEKEFESVTYPTSDLTKITVICGPFKQAFKTGRDLTCEFTLHNEIYFFTAKATFNETALLFSPPTIIYKIQRRDNFRVPIPRNMTHHLEFEGAEQLKIKLTDLSLGGCNITVTYSNASMIRHLKLDLEVALKMTFLSFDQQKFYCKIKFIKDNPNNRTVSLGLEFEKLKAKDMQDMQSTIFKIDRLNRKSALE